MWFLKSDFAPSLQAGGSSTEGDAFYEWHKHMAPRQRATWFKRMEACGRARFGRMGLNFSQFHKMHIFHVVKNHWRDCLIYVSLGMHPHPGCQNCKEMMEEASMTVEEVEKLLPNDKQACKQQRASKPVKDGVTRGRPKKGTSSNFCVWKWLETDRPGMYTRFKPDGDELLVKCNACKSVVNVHRESTDFFIKQHEGYVKHKKAVSSADGTLCQCKGMLVKEACSKLEPLKGFEEAFVLWAAADFPSHSHSAGEHACFLDSEKEVRIRSEICEREDHNVQPESNWCSHCEKLATSKEFLQRVARWVFRLLLIELVHASFASDEERQQKLVDKFKSSKFLQPDVTGWEDVDVDTMERLSYQSLYDVCRLKVACIPKKLCNAPAWRVIEGRFSWLSRKKPVVESLQHSSALASYAGALAKGSLPSEMRLAQHVLNGSLRADSVLRTLVTSLITKCVSNGSSRKRRTTTKLDGVDQADLAETGFALATCAMAEIYGKLLYGNCISLSFPFISLTGVKCMKKRGYRVHELSILFGGTSNLEYDGLWLWVYISIVDHLCTIFIFWKS